MDITKLTGFTPGPWKWGDAYEQYEREPWGNKDYDGPKYADMRLVAGNTEILPIRIDHHEIIWDSANGLGDLSKANRALIAAAPDLLELARLGLELAESVQANWDLELQGKASLDTNMVVVNKAHALREKEDKL